MITRRFIERPALAVLFAVAATAATVLPVRAWSARALPPTPIGLTGKDWLRFGPEERDAYLAGFVAGAAAHQAIAGRAASGARAAAEAAGLQRTGGLTFPFGSNVYRSSLDDYFFYHNRRSETLIQAIVDLNGRLRGGRE